MKGFIVDMYKGTTLDNVASNLYGIRRSQNETDAELRKKIHHYVTNTFRQQFNLIFGIKEKTNYICG